MKIQTPLSSSVKETTGDDITPKKCWPIGSLMEQ